MPDVLTDRYLMSMQANFQILFPFSRVDILDCEIKRRWKTNCSKGLLMIQETLCFVYIKAVVMQ